MRAAWHREKSASVARILDIDGHTPQRLDTSWLLASTPADAYASPDALPCDLDWIAAEVPGTVASALREAGLWQASSPAPLNDQDHWYRTRVPLDHKGTLRFHGLATLASVWLNRREVLSSYSMFAAHDVPVQVTGGDEIFICFHSLTKALEKPAAPGRWRPRMIAPSSLRHVRTTALGHMPGWCPNIDTIGPWRAIELLPADHAKISADVVARAEGSTGILEVRLRGVGNVGSARMACAGHEAPCSLKEDGSLHARLELPDVALWWPHTHGQPALHDVMLIADGRRINLGRTGFRSIGLDTGQDGNGFGLVVNGEKIFSRGAVWASADLVRMPNAREDLRPWLERARDAGMNMLRVAGTTIYEADAFYELCNELGLLVWQDFMFANFDYPASDPAFMKAVESEARQFLSRTQTSPCLAVLCGGSEVYQQAAMLGLPQRKYINPVFETLLKESSNSLRPDVPYVVNSPSGGPLPFSVNAGVAHYFGVGGYKRPLEDSRRANVRFASECLAFANVPAHVTSPTGEQPLTSASDPRWKQRIPRDAGSPWDFEDIRDHYMEGLFVVHAAQLRYADPDRYLELGRATQAHVMEHVFTEWLRPASPTQGGLVLMLQDFQAGAGWGLMSSCGEPKSPWYALRRLFTPLRVTITDEGLNGLDLHLANETAQSRTLQLRLCALRNGRTPVLNAKSDVDLAPRETRTINAFQIIGSFFDISYSYRFQPPQHDTTVATLIDKDSGEVLSEAFHFPSGLSAMTEAFMKVQVESRDGAWWLLLEAERAARFVHIVDENFRPEDDWFHISPLRSRRVRLIPRTDNPVRPRGQVLAINLTSQISYEAP